MCWYLELSFTLVVKCRSPAHYDRSGAFLPYPRLSEACVELVHPCHFPYLTTQLPTYGTQINYYTLPAYI